MHISGSHLCNVPTLVVSVLYMPVITLVIAYKDITYKEEIKVPKVVMIAQQFLTWMTGSRV